MPKHTYPCRSQKEMRSVNSTTDDIDRNEGAYDFTLESGLILPDVGWLNIDLVPQTSSLNRRSRY